MEASTITQSQNSPSSKYGMNASYLQYLRNPQSTWYQILARRVADLFRVGAEPRGRLYSSCISCCLVLGSD